MSDELRPLVWVVDDSPLERAAVIRALGAHYDWLELSDGSDVVERLSSGSVRPDLLLLDWMMPGMTGDEVCRYIRSQKFLADLPIILLTASRVETHDIVAGLAVGANDYVPKPFAPEELRARIDSVLRAKQLREDATRERTRLAALNRLGHALFEAGDSVMRILHELLASLAGLVADGSAITLLPGSLPSIAAAIHRSDPSGQALAQISSLADPGVFNFASSDDALDKLPPLYHPYIQTYGLRGLAIFPFPVRAPVLGVVTVTRDDGSEPFEDDDIATIETCIEYASLAVQNAERFHAERAARSQITAIFDSAPIGILVADMAGAITVTNAVASRLIPGAGEVGRLASAYSLGTWTTPDGAPIDRPTWTAMFGGNGKGELVLEVNGTSRVLSIRSVQLSDEGGTVTTIEDISAQHAINVEREKTAQFHQQMLGIVGHDLRNPLGAILTGSELVLATTSDDAVKSRVRKILSSSQRMTGIVNQLLDITRARLGGGIPVELTRMSLAPLVESVVDELRVAYPAAKLEVTTVEARGVWDPDRLGQVVSNLVTNAVRYGAADQPVKIAVTATDKLATITVTDVVRGEPLSQERLAELFAPFRRGDAALHREGLGLGLYIASEIVRAHKGKIRATSSASEGTTFVVELPRDLTPA